MKILEQYIINRWGDNFIVRLYTNGERRCSCNHFHQIDWRGECVHITSIKNGTANFVSAERREK